MKKNGFTLIEIIATVLIITLIGLLVVPQVRTIINDSKDRAYNSVVSTIEDAAKTYVYLNTSSVDTSITSNGYATVTILTLQQEGLLKVDIENPLTGENIASTDVVRITKSDNAYSYEYIGG